jgi:ABC-type antimicrobial peptide transport system permease subunit
VGVYGVLSFAVNHRAREFGIKMVLGANRGTIFRSVTLQAIRILSSGFSAESQSPNPRCGH